MTRVDVVVAVRNEEEAIPLFLESLWALEFDEPVDLGVIFVEDSSTDRTPELLRSLAATDARVGFIRLKRGYGQALAAAFGLAHSDADAMVMMDVDGSHPVAVIPALVAHFRRGASVVQCVRRSLPGRDVHRSIGAQLFHAVARVFSGVDTTLQNIFFRLVSAPFMKEKLKQPRYLTYMRFPLPSRPEGATVYLHVDTEERRVGASKYDWKRLLTITFDGLLSQTPPARFACWIALAAAISAALLAASQIALAVLVALAASWLVLGYVRRGRDVLREMETQIEEIGLRTVERGRTIE